MTNKPSANIRIILSHTGQSWVVPVIPETTLQQIIGHIDIDPELFNPLNSNPYVFVTMGETVMPWLNRNMIDYNNWSIERGYISSFYIKRRSNVTTN